jgi:hypothetical protein
MWDYYLGGSHNFAADRELAENAMGAWPELPQIARANRAFLRRAVTFLASAGSASSSTWAPASRPPGTCTRSSPR